MADGNVHIHPAVERMDLRRKMMAAIDQLLDAVDLLVRELDDGTPDPDMEPSLGAAEHPAHLSQLSRSYDAAFRWAQGASDDREGDGDRWTAKDADLEPSLGATAAINQRRWGRGGNEDREHEHDGREPQCEDEGAQCEDEGAWRDDFEPDADGEGRPEMSWEIGGLPVWRVEGDTLTRIDPDDDPGEHVERIEVGLVR